MWPASTITLQDLWTDRSVLLPVPSWLRLQPPVARICKTLASILTYTSWVLHFGFHNTRYITYSKSWWQSGSDSESHNGSENTCNMNPRKPIPLTPSLRLSVESCCGIQFSSYRGQDNLDHLHILVLSRIEYWMLIIENSCQAIPPSYHAIFRWSHPHKAYEFVVKFKWTRPPRVYPMLLQRYSWK